VYPKENDHAARDAQISGRSVGTKKLLSR